MNVWIERSSNHESLQEQLSVQDGLPEKKLPMLLYFAKTTFESINDSFLANYNVLHWKKKQKMYISMIAINGCQICGKVDILELLIWITKSRAKFISNFRISGVRRSVLKTFNLYMRNNYPYANLAQEYVECRAGTLITVPWWWRIFIDVELRGGCHLLPRPSAKSFIEAA